MGDAVLRYYQKERMFRIGRTDRRHIWVGTLFGEETFDVRE